MSKSVFRKLRRGIAIFSAFALIGSGTFGFSFVPFLKTQTASAETYSVSGTVLAPDGVTPVSNAHPYAQTLDRMQWYPGNQTGSDGAYTISNIPPGNYIVAANPPDGMAGVTRSNDIMITVPTSGQQNITLNGTPKTITGTITYKGTSTPVIGAVVNAWSNNNGMGGGGQATTDSNGAYTLSLPASSQYGMNLQSTAGADWSYNEPQYMVSFTADNSTESRTANFQVTKATATITGSVTYASSGAPIDGGNVNAWSSNGGGGGGNAQVINGAYTMRVPAGVFNVNYWNQDQSLTALPTMVSVLDNQTVTANIIIKQKTAHITGTTVDANGAPVSGIRLNAWCQPLGTSSQGGGQVPGINGNAESDANGAFDIAVLAGVCNINIDQWGQNQSQTTYVMSSNIPQVTMETDTTSKNIGNVPLVLADATIRVTVKDEAGSIVTGINGFINAQKANVDQFGPGQNFGGQLQPDGTAIIKLPSSVFSLVKLNMFMGQDSQYSISDVGSTVTISANSTTDAVLTLVRNNASIYGSLVDGNGVPLTKCTPPAGKFSFGEVFVFNPKTNTGRNAQFKEDCSFSVSLTPGEYNFNWHFSDGSGLLNGNPSPDLVKVTAGQNVVKNITALVGDAKIRVQVVDPTGAPVTNTWVDASNEIELFGQPGGSGPQDGPKDLAGTGFKDKNGKTGDPFQICSDAIKKKDAKQIKMCKETKLPDIAQGPGGCKNIYDCVTFCSKSANQSECGKFKGPDKGPAGQPQTGPGGCKTDAECKAYCSKTENQQECMKFGPASGSMTGAAFFKGKVKGATTNQGDKAMGAGPSAEDFKNVLRSGSMTDNNGNLTISVISGHKYEVRANPQPGSPYMPAKSQVVDFTKGKSATITLALRQADAKITGTVSGGGPMGYCHAYSDDNNFSGGEIRNGKYTINVSKGTWHIGCDSAWDKNFARTDEIVIVVDGSKKTITQNFKLSANSNFRIPPAFSTTFDASTAQSIILEDGTSLIIPASALGTSGNITLTATPTANLQSTSNAKAAWYGYQFEAKDSNGATITKFNSNVTVIFKYTDAMVEASGVDENALIPRYWDESTNSWQSPDNVTQDVKGNSITISTDHFSKHALTYSAAAVSKISVTKGVGKNLGKITMGKKTVTAFSGTSLNVATAVYSSKIGQLVFVSPATKLKKGESVIKVYNAKTGKLVKTINPFGGNSEINLMLADMTKDGKSDLAVSRSNNGTIKVYDVTNKYKSYNVNTGLARNATLNVTTLEAQQTGIANLAVLMQKRNVNTVKVYQFDKKGFGAIAGLNENSNRIKISGSSLSMVILNPTASKVTGTVKTTSTKAVLTITGTNFNKNTVVTIQNKSVSKIKVLNGSKIQVTVDGTRLSKGKTSIKLVNQDGGKSTYSKLTVK